MFETTKSADGTRIAFERSGRGDPLIVLGGAFNTRQSSAALVPLLDHNFTVFCVDRRGRGDSTAIEPYAVEREVEDLAAVIHAAGGSALVYGHSSGAVLALEGAAAGLRIERLAAYEPPYTAEPSQVGDGSIPVERLARISVPTLLIAGGNSDAWARDSVAAVAAAIPGATHHVIDGQDHGVAFEALAPVLEEFFG